MKNTRTAGTEAGPTRTSVGQASVLAGATRTSVGQASVLAEAAEPRRAGTYVAVLALEAVVIAALWAFGRYFSA